MTVSASLLVRIRPRRRPVEFRELWQYRDLLYFLARRDIQVRYRQAVLGATWALLQPLLSMGIFLIVFGRMNAMPTGDVPYSVFVYAGLVPWIFVANAMNSSGNSLVGHASMLSKVYFPRIIIPIAAAAAHLVDFALALLPLFALLVFHGIPLRWGLLGLIPLLALTVMLAVAIGLALSALTVKYRDVRHALPFLTQLWMFASPVIYPSALLPERWKALLALNPMTGLLEAYRAALFGQAVPWAALSTALLAVLILLPLSVAIFNSMESGFADTV